PGESDRLVLVRDRPGNAVLILRVPLVALRCGLVAIVADAVAPEAGHLALLHPARELLGIVERRRPERDPAGAVEPRSEHLAHRLIAERRVLALIREALEPGLALELVEVLVDVRAVAVIDGVPVPEALVAELLEDPLPSDVIPGDAV